MLILLNPFYWNNFYLFLFHSKDSSSRKQLRTLFLPWEKEKKDDTKTCELNKSSTKYHNKNIMCVGLSYGLVCNYYFEINSLFTINVTRTLKVQICELYNILPQKLLLKYSQIDFLLLTNRFLIVTYTSWKYVEKTN